MRIIEHERIPDIVEVDLAPQPLSVWLDPYTQVLIEKGDKIEDVTRGVTPYLEEYLSPPSIRLLVAYWFAMGEREKRDRINDPSWTNGELAIDDGRRYLK
jgi:hypothetical protein